jgi:hypothetical protein
MNSPQSCGVFRPLEVANARTMGSIVRSVKAGCRDRPRA